MKLPSLYVPGKTMFTVFSNTVSQIATRFLTSVSTFIITYLIASRFGPAGYGDFTKITTYVALFYLVSDFGMNAIYLKSRAEARSSGLQDSMQWQDLFSGRLVLSLLALFLAIGILVFLPSTGFNGFPWYVKLGILMYAPTILFQSILTSSNAVFQEQLRYDRQLVAVIAGSLTSLACVALAFVLFAPAVILYAVLLSLGIGSAITAVSSLLYVRQSHAIRIVTDMKAVLQPFLKALPLGVTLLFNIVYFRVDTILLAMFRSTAEVGIYGLAYKVFEFALVIPTFYMNSLYPMILNNVNRDSSYSLTALMVKIIKASLIISGVLIVIVWFGSPYLTLIRYDFEQSIPLLRILAFGLPFFFVSSACMWLMVAKSMFTRLLVVYGLSMVANITANSVFIPLYGATAAAYITIGTEVLTILLQIISLRKVFGKHI